MRGVVELELIGRGTELDAVGAALRAACTGAEGVGSAIVVTGEPGVGKSSLLDAARAEADRLGMTTLAATGVPSEAQLAFAGLHQLLQPRLARLGELPPRQRAALEAAFGLGADPDDGIPGATGERATGGTAAGGSAAAGPELFLVGLAALELLADAAAAAPLLVALDDAQWLDRASAEVLAFVARRIALEPIVVLAGLRQGWPSPLEDDLVTLPLAPLAPDDAASLLDARAPELALLDRSHVLAEAAGNPLALVELPVAVKRAGRRGPTLPANAGRSVLPLTDRLERAFSSRADDLAPAARAALLVAAADGGDDVGLVLRAAAAHCGAPVGAADLDDAVAAGLVRLHGRSLAFRHPLVRSAVYGAATDADRRAVHAALAGAHAGDPDRQVWHRAAAAVGTDPDLATDLDALAARARGRGDLAVALAAVDRAARLSDRAGRARRLLHAGELAFELAGPELGRSFLDEAEPFELPPVERARLVLLRELMEDERIWIGSDRINAFVAMVEQVRVDGEPDLALEFLVAVAQRCWWLDLTPAARALLVAAIDRMPQPRDDARMIAAMAFADPMGCGAEVAARVSASAPDGTIDPGAIRLLGAAATAVGAYELAPPFLAASVDGLRAEGRLGPLAQALVSQAWTAFFLGDWELAALAAEEAGRLARETGQPRWSAAGALAGAALAACRGDVAAAEASADEAESVLRPLVAHPTLAIVQVVRGLVGLGQGDYGRAFDELARVFDHTDPAFSPFIRGWMVADLAEAADHVDRRHDAAPLVADLGDVADRSGSTLHRVGLATARALVADVDDDTRFAAALAVDLACWPYHRARLLLAYGCWLRRRQRVGEARTALRAARGLFDDLGATPWGERARQELRATGETSRRRRPDARDQLTPQELQIARMAAEGLSNREIGERLYLSHRTVGSHLYRIFPKLGITSRAQLAIRLGAEQLFD